MGEIAERLLAIRGEHGPESIFFNNPSPAGSASGDYLMWMARLAHVLGTPNIVTTRHLCDWHNGVACQYTYGAGMIPAPDIERAKTILLWGHNPKETNPPLAKRIFQAKKRGASLIVVDPRQIDLARMADLWLPVRPGTDGPLAMSMIHALIEEDLYDREFVSKWTNAPFVVRGDTGRLLDASEIFEEEDKRGWVVWDSEEMRPASPGDVSTPSLLRGSRTLLLRDGSQAACSTVFDLLAKRAERFRPERAEAIHGVSRDLVRRAARLFAGEGPSCYSVMNGPEQHRDAT
jgi:anaerobic selenocysteine-containing dehydrogenase